MSQDFLLLQSKGLVHSLRSSSLSMHARRSLTALQVPWLPFEENLPRCPISLQLVPSPFCLLPTPQVREVSHVDESARARVPSALQIIASASFPFFPPPERAGHRLGILSMLMSRCVISTWDYSSALGGQSRKKERCRRCARRRPGFQPVR